ncbi:hypothetical protein BJ912DRAFT_833748, partial [Pholiota molesta]
DDKKGQGDSHVYHFSELEGAKKFRRFPDTSNTRFNSHADAASELLTHLEDYLRFLLLIKDKKKAGTWTNIELNVYRALQDIPTLTELATMALYAQAVTHPYLRSVRGPGTENVNILDLKDFHVGVKQFVQEIIDEPERLTSPNASYETATLDRKPWQNADAVSAIQKLSAKLPHLTVICAEFFKG